MVLITDKNLAHYVQAYRNGQPKKITVPYNRSGDEIEIDAPDMEEVQEKILIYDLIQLVKESGKMLCDFSLFERQGFDGIAYLSKKGMVEYTSIQAGPGLVMGRAGKKHLIRTTKEGSLKRVTGLYVHSEASSPFF